MVMDATQPQQPSPQSVGREFVRQYYTLLNKAPTHLHRFYNHNSSFIHGESTLVVGQKNIHNSILQLNFHDCHAKISQVDAQATLGNGVVVQVTGELSNDGQPMRRFTQTFVLAAQTPKKYYVHNDIFRYQDMYSDEENDGESRSENDEEHEQASSAVTVNEQISQVSGGVVAEQVPPQQLPAQVVATGAGGVLPLQAQAGAPQQTIYYSMPASGGRPVPVLTAPQGGTLQFTASAGGVPPQQVPAASAVNQLNGVVAHEDLLASGMQQQANVSQQPIVAQSGSPIVQAAAPVPVLTPVLAGQTSGVIAAVPIANAAAMPQNAASVMRAGFQQSPLVQQQLHQQQQQQQPMSNTPSLLQSQTPQASMEIDDAPIIMSPTSNDTPSRTPTVAAAPVPEPTPAPIVDDFKTINEQQQQEKYEAAKQQQNEPKTYANLFKSTSSSPSGFVNAVMQQQQQVQQQQQQQQQSANTGYQSSSTISTATYSQSNTNSSLPGYNNRNSDNNSSLRMDNNNIGGSSSQGPLPQRSNSIRKDFEQRRPSQQFGDNQQLFLGNIPHHATEEDLRAIFGRFGTVLELRILSKPPGKLPPGIRNPLNYGFITYDDTESVQNCLTNCPLYFPENTPDAQKLNVEEKKPRMRSNDMPPRQSMGMNNNMNNSQRNMSGPPSRSLSNSGGGMRGGTNPGSNSMSRGGGPSSGPRIGGAFNRNENRSGGPSNGGGPQVRGGGGNNNAQTGGNTYGGRR